MCSGFCVKTTSMQTNPLQLQQIELNFTPNDELGDDRTPDIVYSLTLNEIILLI